MSNSENKGAADAASIINELWTKARLEAGFVVQSREQFTATLKEYAKRTDALDETASRVMEGKSTPLLPQHKPTERIQFPSWFGNSTYLRQQDRANWHNVNIGIACFAGKLIKECQKYSVPMYTHGALRTPEDQNKMFERGVSRLRGEQGKHTQGHAVDIVHSKYHWEMTRDEWSWVGLVGKSVAKSMGLQVTWGGDWKNPYDPAHWQVEIPLASKRDYTQTLRATPYKLAQLARTYDLNGPKKPIMGYLTGYGKDRL